MASLIYILYLATLILFVTSLIGVLPEIPDWLGLAAMFCAPVGVILAYANRSGGPEWLRSHYQFQIRTFWSFPIFYLLSGAVGFVIGYVIVPLVSLIIVGISGGDPHEFMAGVMSGLYLPSLIIGVLSVVLCFVWLIVRCANGLRYIARGEPHPNPASWLF